MRELLDIFVGTDRSQLLAVAVLEHSIKRHTAHRVRLCPLIDLDLPEPKDVRNGSRTGFSFTRFAIPELMGYRGKALYLDADMLVFRDIHALWRLPFGDAKVIIQGSLDPRAALNQAGRPRKRQCSVMMLDCARLKWDVRSIIAGLDGRYDYNQLMDELCILDDDEISQALPFEWNSLEYYDQNTCLLHFTDMNAQPWVSPSNRNGRLWLSELLMLLQDGLLSWTAVEEEIDLGYFRPSLIAELRDLRDGSAGSEDRVKLYEEIDNQAGFEKHAEAFRRKRERNKAIRAYERQRDENAQQAQNPPPMIQEAR